MTIAHIYNPTVEKRIWPKHLRKHTKKLKYGCNDEIEMMFLISVMIVEGTYVRHAVEAPKSLSKP